MISLKDNVNVEIIVDDGKFLASACGNTLHGDKPYRQLSGISIRRKIKRRQAYSSPNIINHVLSSCRKCYLLKNKVVIDSEITSKLKRTLADNIKNKYKDQLMKNKAPAHVNTTIDRLSRNTANEFNNTNDNCRVCNYH